MPQAWLTARDVAETLGVSVDTVYDSPRLREIARVLELGDATKRGRLRWRLEDLEHAFPTCLERRGAPTDEPAPQAATRSTRRRRTGTPAAGVPLLPIRGGRAA